VFLDRNAYVLDLHTHSIASGHAYNTIDEMVSYAKKRLHFLGISEHGVAMPGTCHEYYFENISVLKKKSGKLQLLYGVEADIIDYEGNLDMNEKILAKLDYVIASIHWQCLQPGSIEENTQAYIGAMRNKYVNIIGHPDDGRYQVDYNRLVIAAKKNKVLIEINNSSLKSNCYRQDGKNNIIKLLKLCMKHQVMIILSSDAHCALDIGDFDNAIKIIKQVHFPRKLIVNYKNKELKNYLNKKTI
jgi:putative hydrolase